MALVQVVSGDLSVLVPASTYETQPWGTTPVEGHLLVCLLGLNQGNDSGSMPGWTLVSPQNLTFLGVGGAGGTMSMFYKNAGPAEGTPVIAGGGIGASNFAKNKAVLLEFDRGTLGVLDTYSEVDEAQVNSDIDLPVTPGAGKDMVAVTIQMSHQFNQNGNPKAGGVEAHEGGNELDGFNPCTWVGYYEVDGTTAGTYDVGLTTGFPVKWGAISAAFEVTDIPTGPPDPDPEFEVFDPFDESLGIVTEAAWPVPKTIRIELHGTGSGAFSIRRDHPDIDLIGQGNLVRVTIPRIDPDPIFGFFIESRKTTILHPEETGEELVRVGGRGMLSYLDRYAVAIESYVVPNGPSEDGKLTGPAATGNDAGEILWRMVQEAQHVDRPQQPIPLLTYTFTDDEDSEGDPWADTPMTADLSIGYIFERGYTDGVTELWGTGAIDIIMLPTYELYAVNSYGRDLTSTSFASGKVRFVKGVNIATALEREFGPDLPTTHMWVKGDGANYGYGDLSDAGSRPTVEAGIFTEGTDETALSLIAEQELIRQFRRGESVKFDVKVPLTNDDLDDLTGNYLPGPPGTNGAYWIGDTVTVHTGTGFDDFENEEARIEAINITVDQANNLKVTVWLKATTLIGRIPASSGSGSMGGISGGGASAPIGGGAPAPSPSGAYQLLAQKNQANGYAGLDSGGDILDAVIPNAITRDTELADAISDHEDDTTSAHTAEGVDIVDTGGYYTGTDVEAALQEIGAGGIGGGGGAGGGEALLLDHNYGADDSGLAIGGGSWVDLSANETFTKAQASTLIRVSGSVSAQVRDQSSAEQYARIRLLIDSAGTPVPVMVAQHLFSDMFGVQYIEVGGAASRLLSGLAAGAHTIKWQALSTGATADIYLRPSSGEEYAVAQVTEVGVGGGALNLLEAHTAASSTSLDFTAFRDDALYDTYIIEFDNVQLATDGAALNLRVSDDGGATWESGGSDYHHNNLRTSGGTWTASATTGSVIQIADSYETGSGAILGVAGHVRFWPSGASQRWFVGQVSYLPNGDNRRINLINADYEVGAFNGIRLLASSGNIASGTVRIYGLAKTGGAERQDTGWKYVGDAGQPAYANSWVSYGSGYAGASFRRIGNVVYLGGLIKNGSVNLEAFTLPLGYRPDNAGSNSAIFGVVSNSGIGRVDVYTGGGIVPTTPSNNAWVPLDSVHFTTADPWP